MGLSSVRKKTRSLHEIYICTLYFLFFSFQNKMNTLQSKTQVFVLIVLTGNNV